MTVVALGTRFGIFVLLALCVCTSPSASARSRRAQPGIFSLAQPSASSPKARKAAPQESAGAPATPNLPPTAPTALKPATNTNTFPPLPAPLPSTVGGQRGLGGSQVGNQISSKLRPGEPTPASPTPAGTKDQAAPTLPAQAVVSFPATSLVTPGELRISGLGGSSVPWAIVGLLTLLTLIPSLLICVTPFARLLVVFHFLRQALGLQTTPSNQTLIGLTLIMTFFIMQPVGKQIYSQSLEPLQQGTITPFEAISQAEGPMRNFMVHFVREKDAALFLEIAHEPRPRDVHDLSMRVLLPAYIVSELKAGFQIGAVLFLPFLVVDMVVASITNAVGMMQLPPVVISTPLKLLLFLMVDGWHLLISALMRSFQ